MPTTTATAVAATAKESEVGTASSGRPSTGSSTNRRRNPPSAAARETRTAGGTNRAVSVATTETATAQAVRPSGRRRVDASGASTSGDAVRSWRRAYTARSVVTATIWPIDRAAAIGRSNRVTAWRQVSTSIVEYPKPPRISTVPHDVNANPNTTEAPALLA